MELLDKVFEKLRTMDPQAEKVKIGFSKAFHVHPNILTLSDLGFTRPLFVRGSRGLVSISIPWNSSISLKQSKAVLYFKAPIEILNEKSSITVFVEGAPIVFLKVKSLSESPVVIDSSEIKVPDIGDFLDVSIATSLSITDDRCIDEQTGNLWVSIDPKSYFELTFEDFLRVYGIS